MSMNRRQLLAGGTLLAAAFAAGPLAATAANALRKIGLQLYTVREIFAADPIGTPEKVAKIGYRDRKSVRSGKRVSVRVDRGGRLIYQKKKKILHNAYA